ncbi:MAG: HlyD family efflux transporter periplasmic adaptor subunit [Candidatus Fimivivens sp.]
MNGRLTSMLLSTVMILFVVSYSIYTGVRYFYSPYRTETVFSYTVSDYYRAKTVVVRNERLLPQQLDDSGVVSYVKSDGAVVIPGSVVAKVYTDTSQLRSQLQIEHLDNEIALLGEAQQTSARLLGADIVSGQVNDTVGGIVDATIRCDISDIYDARNRLQLLLGKYRISTRRDENYNERIAYLQQERKRLMSEISQPIKSVTIDAYGYFCSSADGYETQLTTNFEALSIDDYKRAINGTMNPEPTNTIGKVQQGHDWYIVLVAEKDEVERFVEGAMINLDFNIQNCNDIPASVYRVLPDESGDAVVVFKMNYINTALINLRRADVDVNLNSYTGLRISKQALRYAGQTEGVYVKNGSLITFKPIKRIYTSEHFVLCTTPSSNEDDIDYEPINQFDEVIVEGTDIYDGKIV